MLIKSFFRYFSLYWSLDIHITHGSQAERGDWCHAARPLSSWRTSVRFSGFELTGWCASLQTRSSGRGLVRTRLDDPRHLSMIGKSRAVMDGGALTPQTMVMHTENSPADAPVPVTSLGYLELTTFSLLHAHWLTLTVTQAQWRHQSQVPLAVSLLLYVGLWEDGVPLAPKIPVSDRWGL